MGDTKYSTGSVLLAAVLGMVIGGVGGFYVGFWKHRDAAPSLPPGSQRAMRPAAVSGGPAIMGAGTRPAASLVRTVRGLLAIQSVQKKGLTKAQAQKLRPLIQDLHGSDKLTPEEAERVLAAIMSALTEEQKAWVGRVDLRGSAITGGTPRLTRRPTTPLVSGLAQAGGAGPGSGGPSIDPERPFGSPEGQVLLQEFLAQLEALAH